MGLGFRVSRFRSLGLRILVGDLRLLLVAPGSGLLFWTGF